MRLSIHALRAKIQSWSARRQFTHVEIHLAKQQVRLGEQLEVSARMTSRKDLRLERVVARLIGRLRAVDRNDKHIKKDQVWAEAVVAENVSLVAGVPAERCCQLQIPPDAMHTFSLGPSFQYSWQVELEVYTQKLGTVFGQAQLEVLAEQTATIEASSHEQKPAAEPGQRASDGLELHITPAQTRVRLRDKVRGRLWVRPAEPITCHGIVLSLRYEVRGVGGVTVGQDQWDAPWLSARGVLEEDFEFYLPAEPISFRSEQFEIAWFLVLEMKGHDRAQSVPLEVIPATACRAAAAACGAVRKT